MARQPKKLPTSVFSRYRLTVYGGLCVYCGDAASDYDHFPPRVWTNHGVLLPACNECNRAAGVEHPFCFESRASHVKDWLRKRYARLMRAPSWAEEEIDELGYSLASRVKAWERARKTISERLQWSALGYLSEIDPSMETLRRADEIVRGGSRMQKINGGEL